ncbi:MAG TPA: cupredoxin domain-containing protein [Ilumatobacteraceae bacterium]|nr:cupredoxin domain-containing protein [Ilumatobacteraceae bacterium]
MLARHRVILTSLLLSPAIVACGADSPAAETSSEPTRSVEIVAAEYTFQGEPGVIAAGDTIEFVLENVGQLDHSLEVLTSSGSSLGVTDRIPAGGSGSVTVTFDDAGVYRLICDVDDHFSRGQGGTITVT